MNGAALGVFTVPAGSATRSSGVFTVPLGVFTVPLGSATRSSGEARAGWGEAVPWPGWGEAVPWPGWEAARAARRERTSAT